MSVSSPRVPAPLQTVPGLQTCPIESGSCVCWPRIKLSSFSFTSHCLSASAVCPSAQSPGHHVPPSDLWGKSSSTHNLKG